MRALVAGGTNDALTNVTEVRIITLFANLGDLDEVLQLLGMGVRRGEQNGHFPPPWNLGLRSKNFWKT